MNWRLFMHFSVGHVDGYESRLFTDAPHDARSSVEKDDNHHRRATPQRAFGRSGTRILSVETTESASSSLLAGAPGRGLDDGDSCDDGEIYYFNVLTTLE